MPDCDAGFACLEIALRLGRYGTQRTLLGAAGYYGGRGGAPAELCRVRVVGQDIGWPQRVRKVQRRGERGAGVVSP